MNLSDEAVEAAVEVLNRLAGMEPGEELASAVLEAAAPYMLSHERQLTADAHRDAVVNRDTVDRLERELETAKAEAWDEALQSAFNEGELMRHEMDALKATNPYRSQS